MRKKKRNFNEQNILQLSLSSFEYIKHVHYTQTHLTLMPNHSRERFFQFCVCKQMKFIVRDSIVIDFAARRMAIRIFQE